MRSPARVRLGAKLGSLGGRDKGRRRGAGYRWPCGEDCCSAKGAKPAGIRGRAC